MDEKELRERADQRFQDALKATGARDPRDHFRKVLTEMRASNPAAYKEALGYFSTRLIPAVAADASDPIAEWLEYGRVLATLQAPGRTVQLDPTGRSTPYAAPIPADRLVLHLPDATSAKAILVGLPPEMSPAQRAAYDLLVRQSQGS
ncbi:MAG TPA: hypothetical protein VFH27_12850 [Longimicrobiaceae bacterium]|nr:hypothetical protein [Longimicrobiaceae bacterium]